MTLRVAFPSARRRYLPESS